jgi:hypothetical protein
MTTLPEKVLSVNYIITKKSAVRRRFGFVLPGRRYPGQALPAATFAKILTMRTAALSLALLGCLALAAPPQDQPVPGKDGWISMFDGKTLDGWKANDNPGSWKVVDGAITGDGERSHLFWMARECENCEFRAEVRLNHSGNSGMYFRTAWGPGFPKGYEAQVENTSPDPQKTGSLYGISKVLDQLIQDDTWWTQDIVAQGDHIVIKVNGKTVVDTHDTRYAKGYLALQQHNQGSVVQFRKLMMRPLP